MQKEPMKVVPMNSGLNTELLAKAADTALKTTYISSPEMYNQNSEDYGNWASLENQDIQMHHLAIVMVQNIIYYLQNLRLQG